MLLPISVMSPDGPTGSEMRYASVSTSIRHRFGAAGLVHRRGPIGRVDLADPPDLLRRPLPRPIWVHKPVATQLGQVIRSPDLDQIEHLEIWVQLTAKKCRVPGLHTLKPVLIDATGDRGVCICALRVDVSAFVAELLDPFWGVGVSRVALEIVRLIQNRGHKHPLRRPSLSEERK